MNVNIENAEEVLTKTAKPHGNGAHVNVPKEWTGRTVKIVLLKDEIKE